MPGLEFSLQAALTLSRLKPVLHARFGVQPSGCADLEQAEACTPCLVRSSAQSSGLEFSLQAALTLSSLKPVLHASESVALLRPGHYPERPESQGLGPQGLVVMDSGSAGGV